MRFVPTASEAWLPLSYVQLNPKIRGARQLWVDALTFVLLTTTAAGLPQRVLSAGYGAQSTPSPGSTYITPKSFDDCVSLPQSAVSVRPASKEWTSTYVRTYTPEAGSFLPAAANKHQRVLQSLDTPLEDSHSHDRYSMSTSKLSNALTGTTRSMTVSQEGLSAALATLVEYLTLTQLSDFLQSKCSWLGNRDRNATRWLTFSHSWLDRKACDWLDLCEHAHSRSTGSELRLEKDKERKKQDAVRETSNDCGNRKYQSAKTLDKSKAEDWDDDERVLREIPNYVLEYAPLVHLHSAEQFWPCDIEEHLIHTTPYLNYTPIQARSIHPNLTNLDDLNKWSRGRFVYLQSNDDVEERPDWLSGEKNIPSAPKSWAGWDDRLDGQPPENSDNRRESWYEVGEGSTRELGGWRTNPSFPDTPIPTKTVDGENLIGGAVHSGKRGRLGKLVEGGKSDAPAVLVVVNKGDGVVDAFWFYFYSFNLGNVVFNIRFGNHVGDWEHSLVRFQHGVPKAVYFSEHDFGSAYSYEAVEKIGKRPVTYSATGTHAMYATPGRHTYVLPFGLLHDQTDRGPLWDPLLNLYSYTYDYLSDTLRSSNMTPQAPTDWFYFAGHWGDKFYPLSDKRQYEFAGQYHYVNGPLGPRFKNLGRKKVCQGHGVCVVKDWIGGPTRTRWWRGVGEGEEMDEEDVDCLLPPTGTD